MIINYYMIYLMIYFDVKHVMKFLFDKIPYNKIWNKNSTPVLYTKFTVTNINTIARQLHTF